MDKIFSPIKGRITIFIENQGIKKEDFYSKTEISPSNFKGKGAASEIGGDKIAKILTEYESINPDWLLTGQGSMLRTTIPEAPHPPCDDIIILLKEQLKEERLKVEKQAQEIGMLKADNRKLMEQAMGLDISERKSSISQSQSPSKDAPSAPVHL